MPARPFAVRLSALGDNDEDVSNIVNKKTILLTPPTFVKSLWTVLPLAAGSINYDSRAGMQQR